MPNALQSPVPLTEQDDNATDDLREILAGLSHDPKFISSKFFYDERGSELFEQICELPEYYLTQTELGIMQANKTEMAAAIGPEASLIEFGSGSSTKIRILLENLESLAAYVPVDISRNYLVVAADRVQREFPDVEVLPVAADFIQPFHLPNPKVMPVRNVVYFPGSTIGNFSTDAAQNLLRVMHQEAGENGALLIGIDRQKDKKTLESAYNDDAGVTAKFNLNILRRINREFSADFDLSRFRHRAIYNDTAGRIEMYLDSTCDHVVNIADQEIVLVTDEAILTEHSHKYTLEGFAEMVGSAGFSVRNIWSDPDEKFSVFYCLSD
jgi:dimethylhistidine N-methyltransferase